MENKIIPTAEDILESIQLENGAMFSSYISPHGNIAEIVNKAMIEFAKLHVEAALKAASKSSKVRKDTYVMGRGTTEVEQMFNYSNGTSHYVDQVSILNSYPLENIE